MPCVPLATNGYLGRQVPSKKWLDGVLLGFVQLVLCFLGRNLVNPCGYEHVMLVMSRRCRDGVVKVGVKGLLSVICIADMGSQGVWRFVRPTGRTRLR
jgi:hypothetical protein